MGRMDLLIHSACSRVVAGCLVAACGVVVFFVFFQGKISPDTRVAAQDIKQSFLAAALAAERSGHLLDAVSAYEKVLAEKPDPAQDAFAWLKLGMIYFHVGLPTKAEQAYLKAIDSGFNHPDVYLHLGYIKESSGKPAQALEYYAKAELAGSRNPVLYFNMGNVHAGEGRDARALEYLKRAVILDPRYLDAFVNLAIIAARQGEYTDAQFYLEKAGKLGYDAPVAFKNELARKAREK
jgi:tetratricopeptide (TPR) repeat protein